MRPTEKQFLNRSIPEELSLREGGLLALFVFLLTRPYVGIQHDARLYIGYALAKIDPNGIGQDLLFVADGQSSFSVFPEFLRAVVEAVGPSNAAMSVAFAGLLLWYMVLLRLVRHVLPSSWSATGKSAALTLSVALPAFYGATGVFRFSEPYATPRIFAEALVLLSLDMVLLRRTMAWIPLAVGFAIHPIMSLPGLGVLAWLLLPSTRIRVWSVASAIILAAGVTLWAATAPAGIPGLSRFDADWLSVLNFKRALVFVRFWSSEDFARTIHHAIVVILALPLVNGRTREVFVGTICLSFAAVLVTWIGADLGSLVLVAQVQPWRVSWLLALFAVVCMPLIIHNAWNPAKSSEGDVQAGRSMRKAACFLLLLVWLTVEVNSRTVLLTLAAVFLWYAPDQLPRIKLPSNGLTTIGLVSATLAVVVLGAHVLVATKVAWTSPDHSMRYSWSFALSTGIPVALIVSLSAWFVVHEAEASLSRLRHTIALCACLMTLLAFDSRTKYQKYVEKSLDRYIRSNERLIPANGVPLVWPFGDLEPWAFAGSPSWGTGTQGIPAVFSRELAITWFNRWQFLVANGMAPAGDGSLALLADDLISLRVVCPSANDPADIVQPGDHQSVRFKVPKLLQPSALGKPWIQQDSFTLKRCAPEANSGRSPSVKRSSD
jgi:hypothetical protein